MATLKTVNEFVDLANAEFKNAHANILAKFNEDTAAIELARDRKIKEYDFINGIIKAGTALNNGTMSDAIMVAEKDIAALDFENVVAGFSLEFWKKHYGESMILPIVCDIMHYFLRQFQIKEVLNDEQIMHLGMKLLAAQPKLRVKELVFIFNNGLQGTYGPNYQRVGIDTILGWISRYYEDSASYLEGKVINGRQEASRGESPWLEVEKKLNQFKDDQLAKKAITDRIYNVARIKHEKEDALLERQRQVDIYKENLEKENQ